MALKFEAHLKHIDSDRIIKRYEGTLPGYFTRKDIMIGVGKLFNDEFYSDFLIVNLEVDFDFNDMRETAVCIHEDGIVELITEISVEKK